MAALLGACGGSDSSPPSPEPVTLSGTILGPDGIALGAQVRLQNESGVYVGSTDLNGEYRIVDVPQGTYELDVLGSTVIHPDGSKAEDLVSLRAPEFVVTPGARPFGRELLYLEEIGASLDLSLDATGQALIPAGTELRVPGDGPALRFVQTTVVTFPEGSHGSLSVSRAIPLLPPTTDVDLEHAPVGGVVIQPSGVLFDVDPVVLVPNDVGLPPNTNGVTLQGLAPNGVDIIAFGTGTVDPSGRFIIADETSGIGLAGNESVGEESVPVFAYTTAMAATQFFPTKTVRISGAIRDVNGIDVTADFAVSEIGDTDESRGLDFRATGSYELDFTSPTGGSSDRPAFGRMIATAPGFTPLRRDIPRTTSIVDFEFTPIPTVTPPMVTSVTPLDGATGVSLTPTIFIDFNERLDPGVLLGRFTLIESSMITGDSISLVEQMAGNISVEILVASYSQLPSGSRISCSVIPTLEAPRELKLDTSYALLVSNSLRDVEGHAFADGDFSSTVISRFTTAGAPTGPNFAVETSPSGPTTMDRDAQLQASATATDLETSMVVANAPITWTSSDPSIASVSSTGEVRPNAAGITTITAASFGESASFDLTVNPRVIGRVEMELVNESVLVGKAILASANAFSPHDIVYTGERFDWSSSDETVATVDSFGAITSLGAGTTTISVNVVGDSNSDTREITVYAPGEIDDIALSASIGSLTVGDTAFFEPTVMASASPVVGIPVSFSSSNPAALEVVGSGLGYAAVAPGLAVVTATAELGEATFTRDFAVTVHSEDSASVSVFGASRASDPVSGAEVIRHEVSDGAFAESVTTNADGLAAFTNVNENSMSFSTVETAGSTTRLRSYLDVPRSPTRISGASTSGSPVVQLDASGAPAGTDYVTASAGRFAFPQTFSAPVFNSPSIQGVSLAQQQADGFVSAFMAVQDSPTDPPGAAPSDAASAAGFALDLDPTTLGAFTPVIVSPSALSTVAYSAPDQAGAMAPAGGAVRRNGVIFSQRAGVGAEAASGNSTLAFPAGWDSALVVHEKQGNSRTRQYSTFNSMPSTPVQVSAPALDLSSVTWAAGTLAWTLSGSDTSNLDIARAQVVYTTSTANRVEWTTWFSPSTTSITVPGLPASMSDVATGYDLIEYEIEFFAIDAINGFGNTIEAIGAADGSLEGALMNLQAEAHSVFETGVGGGGSSGSSDFTLSFFIDIFGTGTVTVDTGSGPMNVDDQDVLTIAENTSVTVTAIATNGSVITQFEVPGFSSFGGNSTETETFTMTEDSIVLIEIN